MKVIHNIEEFKPDKPVWLTQGTFDGVHIGHQKILKQVVKEAKNNGGVSVLLTFYPHPRLVLQLDDNNLKLLNTIEEKVRLVEELGIEYMIIMPFTKDLSRLKASEFARDILVEQLKVNKLIIGYDHRFGRNREGGLEQMKVFGETYGFEVEEIPAQDIESSIVSSTKIRKALLNGDVVTANSYLGANYTISGKVEEGMQKGTEIGFPTANIRLNSSFKLIPQNGVYAVWVYINEKKYGGMLNIGYNPTFINKQWTIEVHIFEFSNNIYNQEITLEFIRKTRDEINFNNVSELIEQLKKDETNIRKILN
ncbi:MAG: bifunctional riboflavin kinase/FAD synthetase [Bacteroidia bacterium]|nr:bifunctional riboflavin kinase/FAD synthetase [Bacteroidia bacterium]NNJ56598.1 bifunctional riboflavin kinase/FAD synthetase [Bacteroidia bacterium]